MPERRKQKNLKGAKHLAKRAAGKKSAVSKKKVLKAKPVKKAPVAKPVQDQAKAASVSVYDLNGKTVESLALDPLFQGKVNTDIVYQAILKYQAGEREGTASTKNRGDVRGGGKKPWKQKGTGQARHGSRRSPIWRGGGVTFGPSPRDYSYSIPSQIRRSAVVEVVKDKVANGKFFVLSALEISAPKTSLVATILEKFKLERPLVLVEKKSQNLLLASRNIPGVSVKTADEVNALDVASHRECLVTKGAYTGLIKRLKS